MKLIKPTAVDDSIFTSSTVSEDDQDEWVISTAYVVGDLVMVTDTDIHRVYECQVNNTGDYPPDHLADTPVPHWIDRGATNRWKVFDDGYQSQTEDTTSIEYVLAPGRINSLGFLNVVASDISVVITSVSAGGVIYEADLNLSVGTVTTWYEYYFNPIERRSNIVLTDIPSYADCIATVTISGSIGDTIQCGLIMPGFFINLGRSLWGADSGIEDYSIKTVDSFGNQTIVERTYHNVLDIGLFVENQRSGFVQRTLADYRATPALWVGDEDQDTTLVYGFYSDFHIILRGPEGAECSIELEGLG